jgi:hypothetical protein
MNGEPPDIGVHHGMIEDLERVILELRLPIRGRLSGQ